MLPVDDKLVVRLYDRANGDRWHVPTTTFAEALAVSADRAFAGRNAGPRDVERYLESLHLADLALACACAAGNEEAWEHFVREQRPGLYRAADVLDSSGGARDLADALYADLFGLGERDGERQSLFRYFHGRSSLATWLRAVLAQRHVDRLRSARRDDALPDEESPAALASAPARSDSDRDPERRRFLALMRQALGHAMSALAPRDRLRLGCYYAQGLTLAETGRLLGEHEATSSRQLARTRKGIRKAVEQHLKDDARLTDAQITQCFEFATEDAGTLNLDELLGAGSGPGRKKSNPDRSNNEKTP